MIPTVQQISDEILLRGAPFARYKADGKGGDAWTLAEAGIRYLFMGLLILPYRNVFSNVNNAAANVAQAIVISRRRCASRSGRSKRDVPVFDAMTMNERIRSSTAASRFTATLLPVFAGVAILLAAIGFTAPCLIWFRSAPAK